MSRSLGSNKIGIYVWDGTNHLLLGVTTDWSRSKPKTNYASQGHGETKPTRCQTSYGDFNISFSVEVEAADAAYVELLSKIDAGEPVEVAIEKDWPSPIFEGGTVLATTDDEAVPGADGVLTASFAFEADGSDDYGPITKVPVP